MVPLQVSASSLILTLRSSVRLMAASRRTTEAPPAVGTRRGRISQAPSALPELTTTTAPIGFDCQSFLTTARKPIERHLIAAAAVSETSSTGLRAWYLVRVLPAPPRSRRASQKDLLSVDQWLDEIERVIGDTFEMIDEEEEEGAERLPQDKCTPGRALDF